MLVATLRSALERFDDDDEVRVKVDGESDLLSIIGVRFDAAFLADTDALVLVVDHAA